jgi:hypothetical protein
MSTDETKRLTLNPPPVTPYGAPRATLAHYFGAVEVEQGLDTVNKEMDKVMTDLGLNADDVVSNMPEPVTPQDIYEADQAALSEVGKPRIAGLDDDKWRRAVSNAALLGRAGKRIDADSLKIMMPDTDLSTLVELVANNKFALVLEKRGVIDDNSPIGMTERQMQTLTVLTNFTDKRSLKTKLSSIGVAEFEFQQWLGGNSRFKRLYRKFSEALFEEAQPAVNVALATIASDGDLRAIKYFNEISGRWDPNSKQVMDVQALLRGIVEILTSTITDPHLLQQIGGRLSVLVGSLNAGTGSAAAVPQSIAEPTSAKAITAADDKDEVISNLLGI